MTNPCKRYTQPVVQTQPGPEFKIAEVPLFEDPKGKWVKWEDYERLRSELLWIASMADEDNEWDGVDRFRTARQKAIDAVGPADEPNEGYSQEYADQIRTALLRISLPVYLNLKPAYTDPDNVKAICDGLNERIKIAQDALLGLGKKSGE